jgi:peptide/nickel transport system permease protein
MLTTGRQYMYQAPSIALFAGAAVLVVVFAFNLFGDGLRDLLDPRSSR